MVEIDYEANLFEVRHRMATSAKNVGRHIDEIELVAISKTRTSDEIRAVAQLGVLSFGENKAQELLAKQPQLSSNLKWHFVGKIQSNKLKKIAHHADLIQSIDSKKQIDILSTLENPPPILIQLSADGDPDRGGVKEVHFGELLNYAGEKDIVVNGLMHVPPLDMDPQDCFNRAKSVADRHGLKTLSMGMTNDFELAIASGATMIRVGNAIFGSRVYK